MIQDPPFRRKVKKPERLPARTVPPEEELTRLAPSVLSHFPFGHADTIVPDTQTVVHVGFRRALDETKAGGAGLGLDRRPDARSVEKSSTEVAGFIAGLRRARSWRVPPNWSPIDWHEELHAVAITSAWQAKQDYDPSRGVPLGGFVYCRVASQALTRYRQEWRYSLRIAPADSEILETLAGAYPAAHPARAAFESLDRALGQLPERERWLLDQLFWQQRTETGIAAELHISQPAVSKRKRAALQHLRALL